MFVHLNCHSSYSLLSGANTIPEILRTAKALGMEALALTDINGLYGAVHFYKEAKAVGIRPIFGAVITTEPGPTDTGGDGTRHRALLLAKNQKGFGEVSRIITDRNLKEDFDLATRLIESTQDIFILTDDPYILRKQVEARGTENLYIELRDFRDGESRKRIRSLLEWSNRHDVPVVATNDVHFLTPEDYSTHLLLSAIRTNTTVATLPSGASAHSEAWLKPPDEMERMFRDIPQALDNTLRIAEQCSVEMELGKMKFPRFDLPSGETPFSYLWKLAFEGVKQVYRPLTSTVIDRLHHELRIIEESGFAEYFLIVENIAQEARRRGIPTVGRGSAANSMVCYALGITPVDPIGNGLYFERFLNPERTDCPDIDLDFPWNRRDEILEHVYDRYGRDRVAMISTHVTFGSRSAFREAGKAMGVSISEIDRFTRFLPHHASLSDLDSVRREIPECRNLPIEDEPYRSVIKAGAKIEGFPRHLSIHCGGIVIAPGPITDWIPLERSAKGFVVTQYDMYPVEDVGLVKIDLLSQRGLGAIVDSVRLVRENYGVEIDFGAFDPTADPATREVVRTGRTIGCFYIESPGMRNLLRKLQVNDFGMLVAASSIIRPGVAESGMMQAFIERHAGRESVVYLHPAMEEVLSETFGVMIYQEDVIKVAHRVAGMSLGEADSLRRCMSKKRNWESMETYRDRFVRGAVQNGVSEETATEIWRQVESFGGYSFCKGHSASFAVISYQHAYLKAHYPAEFIAGVISNMGGFYPTFEYVEEARRMGIQILLPDVNRSRVSYTTDRQDAGANGVGTASPKHNSIRIGFMQVRGLADATAKAIVEERELGGLYTSLTDFLNRVPIGEKETETLIQCGAFDQFNLTRPELLWTFRLWFGERRQKAPAFGYRKVYLPDMYPVGSEKLAIKSQLTYRKHASPGTGVRPADLLLCLAFLREIPADEIILPRIPDYSFREKLALELECLDLTASAHPMALCTPPKDRWFTVTERRLVQAKDIPKHQGQTISLRGWLVTWKRTRTSSNEYMKFLTLEDFTNVFEVVLFPKTYQRYGHLLTDRGPFIVTGTVENDSGGYAGPGAAWTITALSLRRE